MDWSRILAFMYLHSNWKHHLESYMSRFQLASRLQAPLHRSYPLFYSLELSPSLPCFLFSLLRVSCEPRWSIYSLYVEWPSHHESFLERLRIEQDLEMFLLRSGRPFMSSGRPSRGQRSTGPSWAVHRFLTSYEILDSVFSGRPLSGRRSTVACNPVEPLVLSSAVDRSQHGGRLLPYFSATFTSTND